MSFAMLIIITIITVLLILAGALSFAYVPMFFGIYGAAGKTARGRLVMALLWLAPAFALLCLIIAWSSAAARYLSLLPALYLLGLWFIRPNKQDSGAPQKRFASRQHNIEEQLREQDYKWPSWQESGSSPAFLCFQVWLPSSLQVEKICAQLNRQQPLPVSIKVIAQSNGSRILLLASSLASVQRDIVQQRIAAMINLAWQHDGELMSTEVEAEVPPSYR